MNKKLTIIGIAIVLSGCSASSDVKKVEMGNDITKICVERNDRVTYKHILPSIKQRIEYNGIEAVEYSVGSKPIGCEYTLTYVAHMSWDVVTYLKDATIKLYKADSQIGEVNYSFPVGISFSKYGSASKKLDPLIDKMLNRAK